jgi:hypothetical protein
MNGRQRSFQPSMTSSMAAMRSLTEVKLPRRMAYRVMIEKKISTILSQDPDVGVKCSVILGCFPSAAYRFFHAITVGLFTVTEPPPEDDTALLIAA